MIEVYVSTDVETDGPIPGPHSMLSLGSAAFVRDNPEPISRFYANFDLLPEASPHPDTARWWATQEVAWEQTRIDLQTPTFAMTQYVKWLKNLPGKPVFVGYPAGFDFLFVYWYLIRFAGESPFSFSAIDIKTYAMSMIKCDYRSVSKRSMPQRWFDKNLAHTHNALDDAIEQGVLFMRMLKENAP